MQRWACRARVLLKHVTLASHLLTCSAGMTADCAWCMQATVQAFSTWLNTICRCVLCLGILLSMSVAAPTVRCSDATLYPFWCEPLWQPPCSCNSRAPASNMGQREDATAGGPAGKTGALFFAGGVSAEPAQHPAMAHFTGVSSVTMI